MFACVNTKYAPSVIFDQIKFNKIDINLLLLDYDDLGHPAVHTMSLDVEVSGSIPGRTNIGNKLFLNLFSSGCSGSAPEVLILIIQRIPSFAIINIESVNNGLTESGFALA